MSLPKHKDPARPDRIAKAPYNFVPLPEKALAAPNELLPQDRYHVEERHTGHITCRLTTSSPLYTRCGVSLDRFDQEEARNLPDFFTNPATGEPTIPGSSLRGMLRNLVEIVGHGKMLAVTRRHLFFRTVDDSRVGATYTARMQDKVRGGIFRMQGDNYWIEPCIVGRVERDDLVATLQLADWLSLYDGDNPRNPNITPSWRYQGKSLWVKLHENAREDLARFRTVQTVGLRKTQDLPDQARLVLTGNMQAKKKEFVFVSESHQRVIVDEEVIKRFHDDDQITQWQEKAFPTNQPPGSRRRKKGALCDGEPVFYLCDEEGRVVFLGRAGHFRLPYRRSPFDMVPEGLRADDVIDLAEAMFGYVDLKVKAPARGGRVFVTDASLYGTAEGIWHDELTPKVLSGPKPTSIQLYLTQKAPDDAKSLRHYEDDPEHETTLRGHKLYWHKGNAPINAVVADPSQVTRMPRQHTRIRPVKSGVHFDFTIHFENLSDVELGALLWVLNLAAKEEYRLKLGMGKPLGLGSVAIASELHLTDRADRYARLFDEAEGWATGEKPSEAAAGQALRAFEEFILRDPALNPGHAVGRLEELPRIHTLLTLLAWPGPDPQKTEYMTDLRYDFAKRKVLPTPESVVGETSAPPASRARPLPLQGPTRREQRRPPSHQPRQISLRHASSRSRAAMWQ